jgi:hypothetical protein
VSTPDWFLLIAIILVGLSSAGGLWLSATAFRTWLSDHERIEFQRADDHHLESKEKLDSHEDRALEREARAIDRYTHMVKMIQDNASMTRAVRDQRLRLEEEVIAIKAALGKVDERLLALEGKGSE